MADDVAGRTYGALGRLGTGSRIAGYLIEEQIGAGGMAVVFRVRDQALGRVAALKVIAPMMAGDDEFRARFLRESRAAAAVDSPYIIPVYGAGEADGLLYIATRFVAGGDLATLLRQEGGRLPPERAASLVSQVAAALDAAHAAGLVHRDVKPGNVLVDTVPGRLEHAYLSDFGLSKGTESSTGLTASGQFIGTPDYCAPEQIRSGLVDGRTDQYALACVAFVLLTGARPFRRPETAATLFAHLQDPVPPATLFQPGLPAGVDGVLTRALAKSPGERYPSCGEFAAALQQALSPAPPAPAFTKDRRTPPNGTVSPANDTWPANWRPRSDLAPERDLSPPPAPSARSQPPAPSGQASFAQASTVAGTRASAGAGPAAPGTDSAPPAPLAPSRSRPAPRDLGRLQRHRPGVTALAGDSSSVTRLPIALVTRRRKTVLACGIAAVVLATAGIVTLMTLPDSHGQAGQASQAGQTHPTGQNGQSGPGSTGSQATVSPTPASSRAATKAPASGAPASGLLSAIGAQVYDPYGLPSNNQENASAAPYAVDRSLTTAWSTDWYSAPNFGGLKLGVGLLIDMGKQVRLSSVTVTFGKAAGTDARIEVGQENVVSKSALSTFVPVAEKTNAAGSTVFPVSSAATGRYVLIWLTRLPLAGRQINNAPTYQGFVYNVTLRGNATH